MTQKQSTWMLHIPSSDATYLHIQSRGNDSCTFRKLGASDYDNFVMVHECSVTRLN
jgi:hypothetical protein